MRRHVVLWAGLLFAPLFAAMVEVATASENVPHAPFAQWADVLPDGQFQVGAFYEESEAYHFWAKDVYHSATVHANGEDYGIDINQGYFTFQYGLTKNWSADLALGYTTLAWRYFSSNSQPRSTTSVMDIPFGVRYQIFDEATADSPWVPTLTFRAGAVMPGTYSQDIAFAPGDRSAAIEPEFLLRKHFGWAGLGTYGDALFRWNRTTHNDHYIASFGFFQQIKGWELDLGYRRLGTTQGDDIQFDPTTRTIIYPKYLRENSDSIEEGFTYTTPKRHFTYGFYSRSVLDGANTDGKFWVGGYVTIPFGGK